MKSKAKRVKRGGQVSQYSQMTATDLAAAIGKTRQTVNTWTKAGMPRNGDGTYSLPAVIDWMVQRERDTVLADQALCGGADSPALERYREARAKLAELDLKTKEGALIALDDVQRKWALRVATVAAGLENFADRLPPLLVGKDRDAMRTIIDDEVWRLRDVYSRNEKYCELETEVQELITRFFDERGAS